MISSNIARTAFFLLVIGTLSMAGQSAPQNAIPAEGETLHVLVGKSIVINVQTPLTRVLSSNPAAVETMATSPTQVVIEGKATGSSSLILWDASGRSQVFDVVTDAIPLLAVTLGLSLYILYQQGAVKGSAVAVSPRSFPEVEELAQSAALRLGIRSGLLKNFGD